MNSQISKFVVHMKSYLQMSKVHAIWFLGTQATHQGALGGPLAFLAIQLKKLILMLFCLILRNPSESFSILSSAKEWSHFESFEINP